MGWVRVAVASANGIDIDQTLAEASSFRIYDVDPESFRFIEIRDEVTDVAEQVGSGTSLGKTVDGLLETISDCSLLLVRDIGFAAGGKFRMGWVTVYEAPMPVEKALTRLARSPLFRRALKGAV